MHVEKNKKFFSNTKHNIIGFPFYFFFTRWKISQKNLIQNDNQEHDK